MNDRAKKQLKIALAVLAAVCFFAFVFVPSFVRTGGIDQAACCKYNLLLLGGAAAQWAFENNITNGTIIQTNAILRYLARGEIPKCPIGGAYILTKVGVTPICSKPASEHKLTH